MYFSKRSGSDEIMKCIDYQLALCWFDITFRVPLTRHDVDVHLVHLPKSSRHDGVCLRWHSVPTSSAFTGCWALDSVLVSSIVGLARQLRDDFDPVDISNWLFYPGGRIEVCADCHISQCFMPSYGPSTACRILIGWFRWLTAHFRIVTWLSPWTVAICDPGGWRGPNMEISGQSSKSCLLD